MLQAKHMRNFLYKLHFSLLLVCTSLSTASILYSVLLWAYLAYWFVLLLAQLQFCFLSFSENSSLLVFPWVGDCFLEICICCFLISSGLWVAVQCSPFLEQVLSKSILFIQCCSANILEEPANSIFVAPQDGGRWFLHNVGNSATKIHGVTPQNNLYRNKLFNYTNCSQLVTLPFPSCFTMNKPQMPKWNCV